MSYYHTCPDCGAHLDPQEPCDCAGALISAAMLLTEGAAEQWDPLKSQARGILEKETAPSAANTEDGRAEQTLTRPDSASILSHRQEEKQV